MGPLGIRFYRGTALETDVSLFIVDYENNRTLRSGSNGFLCLLEYSDTLSSTFDKQCGVSV